MGGHLAPWRFAHSPLGVLGEGLTSVWSVLLRSDTTCSMFWFVCHGNIFFSFLFQDLPVLCFPLLRGEFVRLCVCWNQGDVATRMLSAHAVVGSSCGVFPAFVCLSFTPLQSLVSWLQVGFFFVNIDEVYLLIEESWQRNYDVWLQHWDARYQNTLRGLTINFWSRNFRPCLCTCVLLHYACD